MVTSRSSTDNSSKLHGPQFLRRKLELLILPVAMFLSWHWLICMARRSRLRFFILFCLYWRVFRQANIDASFSHAYKLYGFCYCWGRCSVHQRYPALAPSYSVHSILVSLLVPFSSLITHIVMITLFNPRTISEHLSWITINWGELLLSLYITPNTYLQRTLA